VLHHAKAAWMRNIDADENAAERRRIVETVSGSIATLGTK